MAGKTPNSSKFNRTSADAARAVIEKLLPQESQRQIALSLLADSIATAHDANSAGWGITLFKDRVRLNVGSIEAYALHQNEIYLVVNKETLTEQDLKEFKRRGYLNSQSNYRSMPTALGLKIPAQILSNLIPRIQAAHTQLIESASQSRKRTTWYEAHSPGVISYLRDELEQEIPDPGYVAELLSMGQPPPEHNAAFDMQAHFIRWLEGQGLHFTPWQIATFFTALQVKGFVILSGISGTGKTRLAQTFAGFFPQPSSAVSASDGAINITIQPYMLKYGRLMLPRQATRLFDLPQAGETKEVVVTFGGQSQTCRLAHATYADSDSLQLLLRGAARQWLNRNLSAGDTLLLEPEWDSDQDLINFRLFAGASIPAPAPQQVAQSHQRNALFLSVRPDWRDSKSLLGYYNPLTCSYEWTPFLRFLLRAAQSYRAKDGLAWFVILDEMNLARVEYYFADLLSVLESGRDENGFTREPMRLLYPEEAEGDLPPHELLLPPNLYFVGTVNMDETTHAFSPKVLDRAFTIELREADFTNYPTQVAKTPITLSESERQTLLRTFTAGGLFARIHKGVIADYVASHPEMRTRLQHLNESLKPYNLHFGYRVFDEIISFLAAAESNRMFSGEEGFQHNGSENNASVAALDAAILMKVLPKFHGSLGKLEAPLLALLAWCLNPAAPDHTTLTQSLEQIDNGHARVARLGEFNYQYPYTAERILQMLQALYTDGFTTFGS